MTNIPSMNVNFSGLMDDEKKEQNQFSSINFSGLMNIQEIKPETIKENDDWVRRSLESPEKVAKLIEERGTLLDQFTMAETTGGIGRNILGVIAAPFQALESGISNPIIEMQRGNINPIDLISESAKGYAGIKRGQFGDFLQQAGTGEKTSATIGLGISFLVPLALAKLGGKLSQVAQFADKKIVKAVSSFTQKVKGPTKTPINSGVINKIKTFIKRGKPSWLYKVTVKESQ